MLIDQSKVTEVWMNNKFLLDAFKEFEDRGEAAIGVVVNCVRGIFKVHAPENVDSQILVRKHVDDNEYVSANRANAISLESLNRDLRKVFIEQKNILITITNSDLFITEQSDSEFSPGELSKDSVVYEYLSKEEIFYIGNSISPLKKTNEYSASAFAQPTYASVEKALDDYYEKLASSCSCKLLSEAWDGGTEGSKLIFSNKPESAMRDSLNQFLMACLDDATIKPEQNTDESKPVDIKINWYGSRAVALIEVKWTGTSISKSRTETKESLLDYGLSRVREGAEQVIDYVNREVTKSGSKYVKGYLVTFDGRRKNVKRDREKISSKDAWFFWDKEFELPEAIENHRNFAKHARFFLHPSMPEP